MTIDNFQNKEGGGSVRTKLNNAIDRANDLNDRVGAASGAGIVAIDGLGESVRRSLLSGDGSVEITNPDGVSENPNVSVAGYVTSRVGQGAGIAAYDAQGNPLRRSVVSSDGSVEITNPDGVAGNVDLSASGAVSTANTAQDDTQRNLQMDEQVYKIIRDTLGPDAPMPYVLDEANGSYPHTSRGEFARLGGAWAFDRFRRLREFAADERRDSFDPATGAPRGRLYEPERTNRVANPTNDGAVLGVLGSGGSLPDDWGTRDERGLVFEVVGIGSENGLPSVDVRVSGTPTSTGQARLQTATTVDTAIDETISFRTHARAIAGSLENISAFRSQTNMGSSSVEYNPLVPNSLRESEAILFLESASNDTGSGQMFFDISVTDGAPVDITLRVGPSQAELGAFPTSQILEKGKATRPPDLPTYPLDFEGFNADEGTFVLVEEATFRDEGAVNGYLFEWRTGTVNYLRLSVTTVGFRTGQLRGECRIDGGTIFPVTSGGGAYQPDTLNAATFSYSRTTIQLALNGVESGITEHEGLPSGWPNQTDVYLANSVGNRLSHKPQLFMWLPLQLPGDKAAALTAALQSLYNGGA